MLATTCVWQGSACMHARAYANMPYCHSLPNLVIFRHNFKKSQLTKMFTKLGGRGMVLEKVQKVQSCCMKHSSTIQVLRFGGWPCLNVPCILNVTFLDGLRITRCWTGPEERKMYGSGLGPIGQLYKGRPWLTFVSQPIGGGDKFSGPVWRNECHVIWTSLYLLLKLNSITTDDDPPELNGRRNKCAHLCSKSHQINVWDRTFLPLNIWDTAK